NVSGAMDLTSWSILLGLAIVWGGSFFFVELALFDFKPLTIVAVRVSLAAILLHIFMKLTGKHWPKSITFFKMVILMGIVNNVMPFTLLVWSQTHITGGLAAILNGTTPVFTVLVAHFMTSDERITPEKITAVLLGFIGVSIIIGPSAFSVTGAHFLAQIAPLGAALCYAVSTTFGRKFKAMDVRPSVIATGQLTTAAIILVPLALIFDQPWHNTAPAISSILALLALASVSTALAYIAYFRFLERSGATNLTLVTFLVPISAVLLGKIFLDEALLLQHWIGMGFIGLCFVVLDGRPLKALKSRFKH
ncbi:MAG: DMT family transporter, partial [Pseudomonadota bacterium]